MSEDIMTLVFLVMEQAVADADADLRRIMDEMRKRREAIERMRQVLAQLAALREANPAGESEYATLLSDYVRSQLDSVGDMTQLMQMRLQKYLDSRAKMFEMLSNIMKKQSDTAAAIVQNMK